MTLPRELKLVQYEGKPLLASTVVKEIDNIASSWQDTNGNITAPDAYQLRLTIDLDKNSTSSLSNGSDEHFDIDINGAARSITAHRTSASGKTSFNGTFSIPSIQAPLCVEGTSVVLDIFVDQSSVEIFTENGSMSMTNLVFPQRIYNKFSVSGANSKAQYRSLKRIWK